MAGSLSPMASHRSLLWALPLVSRHQRINVQTNNRNRGGSEHGPTLGVGAEWRGPCPDHVLAWLTWPKKHNRDYAKWFLYDAAQERGEVSAKGQPVFLYLLFSCQPLECSAIQSAAAFSVAKPLITSVSPSGQRISTTQPTPGLPFRATKVGRCSGIFRICACRG